MHCASCATIIGRTLTKLDGVALAEASYATEKVRVDFDPKTQSFDSLSAALHPLGYRLVDDGVAAAKESVSTSSAAPASDEEGDEGDEGEPGRYDEDERDESGEEEAEDEDRDRPEPPDEEDDEPAR